MQQQYMQSQQQSLQQHSYDPSGNLAMTDMHSALKPGQAQQSQQQTYHINALAYDHAALGRQQSFGLQRQLQLGHIRRGLSMGAQPLDETAAGGSLTDSAGLEVLVTPNFSSQELNMLLDVSKLDLCLALPVLCCQATKQGMHADMVCRDSYEACSHGLPKEGAAHLYGLQRQLTVLSSAPLTS